MEVIEPAVIVSLLSARATVVSTSRPAMRDAVPSGPVAGGSGIVVVVGAVVVGDVVVIGLPAGGVVDEVVVTAIVVEVAGEIVVVVLVVMVLVAVDVEVAGSAAVGDASSDVTA
jgi:hypothetical protein